MRTLFSFMLLLLTHAIYAQWHDANWVLGGSSGAIDNMIVRFDSTGSINISLPINRAPTLIENASISDTKGNLLFFTNGISIFNRNMDTIPNGLLALPAIPSLIPNGLDQVKGCLFIPWPEDSNRYILLHTTYEYQYPFGHPAFTGTYLPLNIYMTVLDKSLNNGLGGVVSKNQSIVNDTLTRWGGGLSVTKHANGRDWWILAKKHYSNVFYKLLLTPLGITSFGVQSIGPNNYLRYGELYSFSPDGTILAGPALDNSTSNTPIVIMEFDRCNGNISNYQVINHFPQWQVFISFSQNSKYLYAFATNTITQFDLQGKSIPGAVQASAFKIADTAWSQVTCDSNNVLQPLFTQGSLAPNGKVYITSPYPCSRLLSIDQPDSSGVNCDMNYSGFILPVTNTLTLPNFPNYRLGPLPGSACDSLTSVHELQAQDISLYPNPASDRVQISASRALNGAVITLFNVQGQHLLQQTPGFGTTFEMHLPGSIQSGIYFIRIQSNEGVVTKKVVLRR